MKILRRALSLILPAVLLLAQHGALAHVISHLDRHEVPAQEKTLAHLKLCGKCVSLEKLSHVASSQIAQNAVPAGDYLPTIRAALPCVSHVPGAYRARAPPVHLLTA
jgi:hypothetical protein